MRSGVKQIMLLKRCKENGFLTVRDAREIYEMPLGRNSSTNIEYNKRAENKLKTLEIYGFLEKQNRKYILTKKGEDEIDEWEG